MGSGKKRDEKIIKEAKTKKAQSRDDANRVEKRESWGERSKREGTK